MVFFGSLDYVSRFSSILVSYGKEQFGYKLSLIQKELETINNIIDKHDNFTQATKNWCVVIWIGTLSLILKEISNSDMMKLLFFTPVIPIMFWIIDATWRRLQNRSIYRSDKISEFLNSKDFTDSYSNYELKNFKTSPNF